MWSLQNLDLSCVEKPNSHRLPGDAAAAAAIDDEAFGQQQI